MDLRGADLELRTGVDELTDDVRAQIAQAHRTVPLLLAPMAVLSVFVLWLVLTAATSAAARGGRRRAAPRSRAGRGGRPAAPRAPPRPPGRASSRGRWWPWPAGRSCAALLPGESPFEAGPGFAAAVLLALVGRRADHARGRGPRRPRAPARRGPQRTGRLGAVGARRGRRLRGRLRGHRRRRVRHRQPRRVRSRWPDRRSLALLTGLLLAHLAAPAGRALGRRLLGRGRLVAGTSLLETGRRSEGRTVIVVVTVACALAVFAIDALAIGERNRSTASRARRRRARGAPAWPAATSTASGRRWARPTRPAAARRPCWSAATPWPSTRTGSAGSRSSPAGHPRPRSGGRSHPRRSSPWRSPGAACLARRRGATSSRPTTSSAATVDVRLSLVVTSATGVRRQRSASASCRPTARADGSPGTVDGLRGRLPAGRAAARDGAGRRRSTATSSSPTCASTGARSTGCRRPRTGTRPRTRTP